MKKLALMLVAAAALVSAVPASAQSVSVGPGGVRVDTDSNRGYRGDRGYRGRNVYRSRGEYRSNRVVVVPRDRDRRRDWDRRRNRTIVIER